jgi:ActR/RegA family two-component response regulator
MDWIRRNKMFVLIGVALLLSFAVNQWEAAQQELETTRDNVSSCVRANTRGALTIAFERRTARARLDTGDFEIAADYSAYARGGTAYLAIAQFIRHPEEATRVHRVQFNHKDAIVLTPRAEELILEGCARAFHAEDEEIPETVPALGLHNDPGRKAQDRPR